MLAKLKSKIANQILCPSENNEKNLNDNHKKSQQIFKKSGEIKKNGGLEFNFKEEFHDTSEASEVLTTNSIVSGIEKKNSRTLKTSQRTKKEISKPTLVIDNKKMFEYYKGKKVDENPSKSKTFLVKKKNEPQLDNYASDINEPNQEITNIYKNDDMKEEAPLKLEELLIKSEIFLKNNELNGIENKVEETYKTNDIYNLENELKFSQSPTNTKGNKKDDDLSEEELKCSKRKENIKQIHQKNSKNIQEKRKLQEKELKIIRNKSEGSVKFQQKQGFKKMVSKGSINKKTIESANIIKHGSEDLINQMNENKSKKDNRKINLINNNKTKSTPARIISSNKDSISGKTSLEAKNRNRTNLEFKENFGNNRDIPKKTEKSANNIVTGTDFNPIKYKAFDLHSLEYDIVKELDNNIKSDLNEEFIVRMEKDVERRLNKEETIKLIIKDKKKTLNEEDRVKTFNRLIQDANRRMESNERLKELQENEEKEKKFEESSKKKYINKEWEEIYENRFRKFNDDKNRKIKEKRSEKKAKEKEIEQIIIDQINSTKRFTKREIQTSSKRMCDEEIVKRKENLVNLSKKYKKDVEYENFYNNQASIRSNPEKHNYDSDHLSNYYSGKETIKTPKYTSKNKQSVSINQISQQVSPKAESSIELKSALSKNSKVISFKNNCFSNKNINSLNKLGSKNDNINTNKKAKSFKSVDFKHLIKIDQNNRIDKSNGSLRLSNEIKCLKSSYKEKGNKKSYVTETEALNLVNNIINKKKLTYQN